MRVCRSLPFSSQGRVQLSGHVRHKARVLCWKFFARLFHQFLRRTRNISASIVLLPYCIGTLGSVLRGIYLVSSKGTCDLRHSDPDFDEMSLPTHLIRRWPAYDAQLEMRAVPRGTLIGFQCGQRCVAAKLSDKETAPAVVSRSGMIAVY